MTFALPGTQRLVLCRARLSPDPFIHQEIIEILYHTLWETVHVFFEHRELGHDAGEAGFLYPFLGQEKQQTRDLVAEVAASIQMKVRGRRQAARAGGAASRPSKSATPPGHSRAPGARRQTDSLRQRRLGDRCQRLGARLRCSPRGYRPVPAVSLSLEPANITAIANDVGIEVIFLRQLIAQARPEDVAIAISTSGGSRNIIMALEEARKRKLLTVALLGYDGGEILRRGTGRFPGRGALRLHSPHSGSAGFDLSHHSRHAGGRLTVARFELYGTASCPYTQEMREWLELRRYEFVEYDVEADAAARERMRALTGGVRTVPVLVEDRQSEPGGLARPGLHGGWGMKAAGAKLAACSIRVRGVVQGVGFRPFVYRLAHTHALTGWVLNGERGVEIFAEGGEQDLQAFIDSLKTQPPPAASIAELTVEAAEPEGFRDFAIRESERRERPTVRVSPDLPVCDDCLRELFDPADRRYRYPYINCTNCGPRYTVILALPYDRPNTTMKAWPLDAYCDAASIMIRPIAASMPSR